MAEQRRGHYGRYDDKTALLLLSAVGISSAVSQLSLSPVYGCVPSSAYHDIGILACAILAQVVNFPARRLELKPLFKCVPMYAAIIPTLQHGIFKLSAWLGAEYGPLITECITLYPLIFTALLYSICLPWPQNSNMLFILSMVFPYVLIVCTEIKARGLLAQYIGSNIILTRSGLQYMMVAFYSCLLPSRYIIYGLIICLGSMTYNPHLSIYSTTKLLNSTLELHDWALVERHESLTGYVSVLRNQKDHYQVLRCDHSLLGGEWLITQNRIEDGMMVEEPIYSVFTMLEAVRLMEFQDWPAKGADISKNALVIGLGIGTSSKALVAHGINTTTVEIDPYIYDLAVRHFGLSYNHNIIIEDAMTYVQFAARSLARYDFILHDVFTGGAEPLELFTVEFLTGLRDLLKPRGAIAINYAGDLASPATRVIVNTVQSVFPRCRSFRDNPKTEDEPVDFVNLVIFCTRLDTHWVFRPPVEEDYLQSQARRANIPPKLEVDWNQKHLSSQLLWLNSTRAWGSDRRQSAINHWKIMRTAVPDIVWETW